MPVSWPVQIYHKMVINKLEVVLGILRNIIQETDLTYGFIAPGYNSRAGEQGTRHIAGLRHWSCKEIKGQKQRTK
jgi:hypothetical protein